MINPTSEGPINPKRDLVFNSESANEIKTDPLEALGFVLKNPPAKKIHASKKVPHTNATRNATMIFSRFQGPSASF